MTDTHLTAPTRFVEVDGDRFAYRRWGNDATGQPPLFLLQHFRGGMDHWDPLMTDGLAAGREVLLYDGRGVASSSGTPRTRIEHMADDAAAVIRARVSGAGSDLAPSRSGPQVHAHRHGAARRMSALGPVATPGSRLRGKG